MKLQTKEKTRPFHACTVSILLLAFCLTAPLEAGKNDHPADESEGFCPKEFKKLIKRAKKHLTAPIAKTERETEHPTEIPKFGMVLKDGQGIPDYVKKDGHYVYIVAQIDGAEYLVWSERAPGAWPNDPTKNLVTHSTLIRQLMDHTGKKEEAIKVFAAGQVQILNGFISRLDNKSGTRRGTLEHLAFAENRLEIAGLLFGNIKQKPITQRDDYSKAGADIELHKEADAMARIKVRVEEDKDLLALRASLVALHNQLYQEFPEFRHKTTLGYLDIEALFDAKYIVPEKDMPFEDYFELQTAKYAFKYLQVDGPDLAALNSRNLPQPETTELFKRAITILQKKKK